MRRNWFAHIVTALVFVLVFASVFVSQSQSGDFPAAQAPRTGSASTSQEMAPAVVSDWQQVNTGGFDVPNAVEVSAVEEFNGYLYAGTHNPLNLGVYPDGAQIFRSADGDAWTPVTQPGFGDGHDIAAPAILDFAAFNGRLYAGTGRGNASQLWRSLNGTTWAPVDVTGFSDPDNVAVTALAVYGSKIYAGVTNAAGGAQIWSSFTGDNNSWTQVGPAPTGDIPAAVTDFAEFGGALYAAITLESDATAQVWRSFGGAWETVVSNGFGNANTMSTGGMAVHGGYLYVGAGNANSGAQLWRSSDGDTWNQIITSAFGDANNVGMESVAVFENQLYVSVHNAATGIEIWRKTAAGPWEQANSDGFGDSGNSGTNYGNATAEFLGRLYVGTLNSTDGGELWRMLQPYGVDLSPDTSLSGAPGVQVHYSLTITNTGDTADVFNLTRTGQTWPTTLSTPSVTLGPSASASFTVDVSIPAAASGADSDSVTVTATSQGDGTQTDSAVLTTSVVAVPVYDVDLSPDASLPGPAGTQVHYLLTITNTGDTADVFNLTHTGQTWPTTLSTSSVNLGPSASANFTVDVSIPAAASGADSDSVTVTATSQGDGTKTDSAVLTTSVVAVPVYDVDLSPDASLSGPAGTQVHYSLTITNTGDTADVFNLTRTGQTWPTALSTPSVNLAPSASANFTVDVSIPAGAMNGANDTVTITATSQGDGSKTDSAILTTTAVVAPVYRVDLSPNASLPGAVGSQVHHTLTITNTGDIADTFALSLTGQTWTSTLSTPSVNLAPLASTTFNVNVSIPAGATNGANDTVTITATSQGDGSKTDSAILTTTAVVAPVYGVDLSPNDSLPGATGSQVHHTVTITNTGDIADTFALSLTGQTWTSTLSTPSVNLAPLASTTFNVNVSIPAGATNGANDTVTITATSQGDGSKTDSAILTTTAVVAPVYGVDLSPNDPLPGATGSQVHHTVTITNTGDIADTFALSLTGQTWTTNLSTPSVNLAPLASATFSVIVSIPASASDGASDTVTVSATSQGDGGQTDSALLTTTAGRAEMTYVPILLQSAQQQ